MKLKSLYEQSPKDYEQGQGFDPDDAYKDVDWDQIEREHEEREARKREEKKKALQITDGNKYRISRSLVNRDEIDKITTLEGMFPEDNDDLVIVLNGVHGITSLKGIPKKVQQLVITNCNGLVSMDGGPEHVTAYLTVSDCKGMTYKHGPKQVDGDVRINGVKLESVADLPRELDGDLQLIETGISDLHNIHKHLKLKGVSGAGGTSITITGKEPLKNGLGFLLMPHLFSVWINGGPSSDVEEVINAELSAHPHETTNIERVLEIQEELIEAGFEEFAKL